MFRSTFGFLSALIFSFIIFQSCDALETKEDDCDENKWASPQDPIISFICIADSKISCAIDTAAVRWIKYAESLHFTGNITKIYCSGEISSSFPYNSYFYPDNSSVVYDIKVGQAYQFKFQHDKDHLTIVYRIKATFTDGAIYESDELVIKSYYKDLLRDINTGEYYIQHILQSNMVWFRVSS